MTDYRSPWPTHIYDVCAWFYWAPRDFNRLPDPQKKQKGWAPVERKLKCSEVALNHIIRILFALAPDRIIAELTAKTIGEAWLDRYHVVGEYYKKRYNLPNNSVQPDFIFDGSTHFVTMEMKIKDKTHPVQLKKYLYLHVIAKALNERHRDYAMIYIGPKYWQDLWKDKQSIPFPERLQEALDTPLKTVGMDKVPLDIDKLRDMADRIRLGYMAYQELFHILTAVRSEVSQDRWEGEVAARLLDGAIHELIERRLAVAEDPT